MLFRKTIKCVKTQTAISNEESKFVRNSISEDTAENQQNPTMPNPHCPWPGRPPCQALSGSKQEPVSPWRGRYYSEPSEVLGLRRLIFKTGLVGEMALLSGDPC